MAQLDVDRRDDGVTILTLDDPDRRNAMTESMGDALVEAFRGIGTDDRVRAVVLTGTPPAFSAGGDLDMLEDHARRTRDEGFDATDTMKGFYRRFLAVRESPVPVVAAVNGHAVGAGLCVALACDLAYVAEDAKLGLNFAQLGLHPGMGGTWLLPRRVGEMRAAELLYTGRLVGGVEAAGIGMALDALPTEEVLPRAIALAEQIASSSPLVVRQLRRSLRAAPTNRMSEQLDLEAGFQAVNYGTDDLVEGLEAVRARRRPAFTGT